MNVIPYTTAGGKNVITAYIDKLSPNERMAGNETLKTLAENGLDELQTSHWQGKIYEIYFYKHNRIFYVTQDNDNIYLLHACRKQKNKTEKIDSEVVIKRAKELGKIINKKLI
jgi:phage-related protein